MNIKLEYLYGILALFEAAKLKLRTDKWLTQEHLHIFISENNPVEKKELEEEESSKTF